MRDGDASGATVLCGDAKRESTQAATAPPRDEGSGHRPRVVDSIATINQPATDFNTNALIFSTEMSDMYLLSRSLSS